MKCMFIITKYVKYLKIKCQPLSSVFFSGVNRKSIVIHSSGFQTGGRGTPRGQCASQRSPWIHIAKQQHLLLSRSLFPFLPSTVCVCVCLFTDSQTLYSYYFTTARFKRTNFAVWRKKMTIYFLHLTTHINILCLWNEYLLALGLAVHILTTTLQRFDCLFLRMELKRSFNWYFQLELCFKSHYFRFYWNGLVSS